MAKLNPANESSRPNIISYKQNTEEWHAWRLGKIGASDVPVILRQSPWDNPYSLYLYKTGKKPRREGNVATSWGHQNESRAVELYTEKHGFFGRAVTFEMSAWPEWMLFVDYEYVTPPMMSCSADFYCKAENRTAEIKCPFEIGNHLLAKEGTIPQEFYPQLQANLFVTQAEVCDYVSYWKYDDGREDLAVIPCELSREYVSAAMMPAVDEFVGFVMNGYPMPEGEKDFTGPDEIALGQEASLAKAALDVAQSRYDSVKARLAMSAWRYKRARFGPIQVIQTHYNATTVSFERAAYIKFEIKRRV